MREMIVKIGYHLRVAALPAKRRRLKRDYEGQAAAERIMELLGGDNPCMIGRWGGTELAIMLSSWDIADRRAIWRKRWRMDLRLQ